MTTYLPTGSILGELTIHEVYIAHDGPRLFSCKNRLGTSYFGLFVEEDDNSEIYLFSAVSPTRFTAIRSGQIPLRAAFTEPHDGWVFVATFGLHTPEEEVSPLLAQEIDPSWLPDDDAFLRYETPTALSLDIEELTAESSGALRSVAAFELDAPYRTTQFSLRDLGGIMRLVQDNMDSLGQVVQNKKTNRGAVQQDILERSQLDFHGIRAASFAFTVTPSATGQLIEDPQIQASFSLLLGMISAGSDEAALREALATLHGRARAKYRDLLEALEDADSGITLMVADPTGASRTSTLDRDGVGRSLKLVRASLDDDAKRRFTVEAILVGINVRTFSFEILDEANNKKYSGRVDKEARARLVGLTTGERYEVVLLEEAEVLPLTGEIHHKYRMEAIWEPGRSEPTAINNTDDIEGENQPDAKVDP